METEESEMSRSIRMPRRAWEALDLDAGNCRRSSTKQLEAILTVYYGLDEVELRGLDMAREIVSPQLAQSMRDGPRAETAAGLHFGRKIPHLTDDDEAASKRSRGAKNR